MSKTLIIVVLQGFLFVFLLFFLPPSLFLLLSLGIPIPLPLQHHQRTAQIRRECVVNMPISGTLNSRCDVQAETEKAKRQQWKDHAERDHTLSGLWVQST